MALLAHYPISLDIIEKKISKKNDRCRHLFASGNVKKIVNEFGEEITRIDGDIPIDLPIQNGNRFLFVSYDQSVLTHGLHKYPAKFFPELPRWIIRRYSHEGAMVLDPFSGSGTTNVEAFLNGRHSVGIDVDPFSQYLSKVKTTPLNKEELELSRKSLFKSILNYTPSKVSPKDIPVFPYRDKWFHKEIIHELAYLRKLISLLNVSESARDFFRICFSSIIRAVSNADDHCTRTVIRKKLNKKVYPADALKKFVEALFINIPKIIEFSQTFSPHTSVCIPEAMDARNIAYRDHFDLAVTSPPYVNAVDYPRTHQLESYWLELTSGSLIPLKKKHVGTESILSTEYKKIHKTGIEEADVIIAKIFTNDPKRSYIAAKYLEDMKLNMLEVYKALKTGGRYIIVVGNNKIRGELFESWKYMITLANNTGFTVENYFASEIIKHFIKVPREERIDTDWILILRK
jgi:DNA modification methylase